MNSNPDPAEYWSYTAIILYSIISLITENGHCRWYNGFLTNSIPSKGHLA